MDRHVWQKGGEPFRRLAMDRDDALLWAERPAQSGDVLRGGVAAGMKEGEGFFCQKRGQGRVARGAPTSRSSF